MAGVLIADYFLVRRMRLEVRDLYRRGGIYESAGGFNPRALVALGLGILTALIGLLVPALRILYAYAWFAGFGVAFLAHWALTGTATVKVPALHGEG